MATVLIVDDEPANRLLLGSLLTYAGHRIVEADDGFEGLAIARDVRPDLIIIDLSMPGMNGTTFMKVLRADPNIGETLVLLYTASSMSQQLEDFIALARIDGVIPKPSEPQDALTIVADALTRGSIRRSLTLE